MRSDPAGSPYKSGSYVWLGLWQKTDASQLQAQAIFDNFALRLHDEPPVGITRAVQLTWPAPAGINYVIEAATNVHGPFLPIQDTAMPGLQKVTLPASQAADFFRLRKAP